MKPLRRLEHDVGWTPSGRAIDLPRYRHPNGWIIAKQSRSWSWQGQARGLASQVSPSTWWDVRRPFSERELHVGTLRECREWADAHEWDYATKRPRAKS